MNNTQNQNTPNNDDEIDLLALAKTVWNKRKLVFRIVGLFIVLGLLVALLSPKEYTASSTYIPQTSEGGKAGGSLGGLASLAGINLGGVSSGSEIPPSLYPKIVNSIPFKMEMLKAPLKFEGIDQEITYQEFYEDYYSPGVLSYIKKLTIGLPGLIIGSIKGDQKEVIKGEGKEKIISITEEQLEHFKRMEGQITISFNDEEGFVQLSTTMPEPLASAQLAKYAESLLQKEVIAYKIQNAREQLKFTQERYQEKKEEFEAIQAHLARFRDQNQNIASSVARNQLEKLEAEYNLAFGVYSELAKQLENAKLQVSKDTPIFSVIQPVTVPAEKSAPKRPLILVIFTILGVVIALGAVFGREYLQNVKEEWNNETLNVNG
ncbi:Wzz/FepE/Etk N-terminal domain-containing protein [Echinicola jeungdonensis]|uniref:Wzz/FepE/Etk N-terminal domain-containing protein n=1 Tax=Echinicola jeungdonensis TaxID=709343 RepID=A0ABV5J596_9BACT|nr:Wzz/FepE/Etk N-terminal domain-containing protein [Echinicola jeungdonensis]MDN3668129.1 Wzz/FepE/Etk N-terminal domain-containing protein [Echinicola jeungdonensis]